MQHSVDSLNIRKAEVADFSFIYDLYRQTLSIYSHLPQERQYKEVKADFERLPFEILVDQGKAVGAIAISDQGNILTIHFLAILPTHQRRGLGTYLLRPILAQATQRNIRVGLSVIRDNPAREFYEQLGFDAVGSDKYSFFMERQLY